MKWYMTVGYPGGEFACKDERRLIRTSVYDGLMFDAYKPCVRPCPPDVVEWVEAGRGTWYDITQVDSRYKVDGGWLYRTIMHGPEDACAVALHFIPVPGTANLTILPTPAEGDAHE